MNQPLRLAADAAHEFGGIALDRSKPLQFRVNGHRIHGFAGDTVLSALLAAGVTTYGTLGETPLGLTDRFAPLANLRGSAALPIERLLAADRLDLTTTGQRRFGPGTRHSLGHTIDGIPEPPWAREPAVTTLGADLLIVGGGVAGLAAADAAAQAGRSVILVERRAWLGGDARYFGPVGDEQSPAAVTADLIARVSAHPNVTVLAQADLFALQGTTARVHRITEGTGSVVGITAQRIVLATGSLQRLPVFAGNRRPGVMSAISAYHLAKRYGVVPGRSVVVATQSNYGYRLALRLHDAGITIKRIVDPRINPQSRFVDFAKASGLTLAGGQSPVSATPERHGLKLAFTNAGSSEPSLTLDADALIVSGPFYPDLTLWMLAGGGTQWHAGRLQARGQVEHIALAGAAAGYRSLAACTASGRAAQAALFGAPPDDIEDIEIGAPYETPEAPAMLGPVVPGHAAFFDGGTSLIVRPDPTLKPLLTTHAQAPSLGDVAASVDLGLTSPNDAGAVAEERGATGGDLNAASWSPPSAPLATDTPQWLANRFPEGRRVHLIVDGKRRFERGALVYANTSPPDPAGAIGVIVADPAPGMAGGIALISGKALARIDRFIVETLEGPSPARIAED